MRLRMRVARPMARGRKRLSVGPSSAVTARMRSSSPIELVVVLGVGDRGLEQLAPVARRPRGACDARIARASSTDLPRMWSQTRRALRADVRTYLACARTTGAARRRVLGARGAAWRRASPPARLGGGLRASARLRRSASASAASSALGLGGLRRRLFGAASPRRPRPRRPSASSAGGLLRRGLRAASASPRRRLVRGVASASSAASVPRPRASSRRPSLADLPGAGVAAVRCASARTRRACGRPSTR